MHKQALGAAHRGVLTAAANKITKQDKQKNQKRGAAPAMPATIHL
jgi:hypothetical protein